MAQISKESAIRVENGKRTIGSFDSASYFSGHTVTGYVAGYTKNFNVGR